MPSTIANEACCIHDKWTKDDHDLTRIGSLTVFTQLDSRYPIKVKESLGKGMGISAKKLIPRGTRIPWYYVFQRGIGKCKNGSPVDGEGSWSKSMLSWSWSSRFPNRDECVNSIERCRKKQEAVSLLAHQIGVGLGSRTWIDKPIGAEGNDLITGCITFQDYIAKIRILCV